MSSEKSNDPDIRKLKADVDRLIRATLDDPNLPEYFKRILQDSLSSSVSGQSRLSEAFLEGLN